MDKLQYKEYIIRMIEQIDDIDYLKRIYNYVHKFFIRRTGE